MTPYPPNPPENPPHPFIPGSPGWLAYERGRAAADSWWRSRLESDEAVRVAARKVRAAITAESLTWDTVVRVAFAAVLPVAGGSGGRSAPGNFRAANLPAEKPETDT